jgi:hypothetical protein
MVTVDHTTVTFTKRLNTWNSCGHQNRIAGQQGNIQSRKPPRGDITSELPHIRSDRDARRFPDTQTRVTFPDEYGLTLPSMSSRKDSKAASHLCRFVGLYNVGRWFQIPSKIISRRYTHGFIPVRVMSILRVGCMSSVVHEKVKIYYIRSGS